MKVDNEILQLHEQGFVTGAIALRLKVDTSYVRSVVSTHLKVVTEASKPHYASKAERHRAALEAKVAKAQKRFEEAKAALAETD